MNNQKLFDIITKGSVLTLIASAFYLASRSFWGVDLHRLEIVVLSTLTFASCAWLLSSILPTAQLLWTNKSPKAAGVVLALGIFLLILEISLTKMGFAWLKGQSVVNHIVFTDIVITTVAVGLSVFNIFAKWAFITVVDAVKEVKQAQAIEAAKQARRNVRISTQIAREKAGLNTKGRLKVFG